MEFGNTAVVFMVLAVVLLVLSIAFTGLYFLNRMVDRNGKPSVLDNPGADKPGIGKSE
jgi:hypothetical protein